jgi:hypothetical protein
MSSILEEAQTIIWGDREQTYGDPAKNLRAIADLWEMYLHHRGLLDENADSLRIEDVAQMMILLKVARLINTPDHRDSLVDLAGYAGLMERVQSAKAGRTSQPDTPSTGISQAPTFVL